MSTAYNGYLKPHTPVIMQMGRTGQSPAAIARLLYARGARSPYITEERWWSDDIEERTIRSFTHLIRIILYSKQKLFDISKKQARVARARANLRAAEKALATAIRANLKLARQKTAPKAPSTQAAQARIRYGRAAAMREEGLQFKEIGKAFGISATGANRLVYLGAHDRAGGFVNGRRLWTEGVGAKRDALLVQWNSNARARAAEKVKKAP